jgi:FixJ family two-component response regulator
MSLIPKKGTVYVVDDDEGVRDSLQWLLEGKDYRVRCYDSAETFLSRYDYHEKRRDGFHPEALSRRRIGEPG